MKSATSRTLLNSLNRIKNHPLIKKYLHMPFKIYLLFLTNITDDYNDTLSINNNCTNNDNDRDNNTFININPMRNVNYVFNIPHGIYVN